MKHTTKFGAYGIAATVPLVFQVMEKEDSIRWGGHELPLSWCAGISHIGMTALARHF
jgi:hypothetical protein